MSRVCPCCGVTKLHHGGVRYCWDCYDKVKSLLWAAIVAVRKARRNGVLPDPHTQVCADCGKPAFCYDHRDYSRPLDVAPVCRSCNWHRWPAKQFMAGAQAPAANARAA